MQTTERPNTPSRKKNQSDYGWQQVLFPAPFTPRDGAGALTFQDKMWLIGGWNCTDKVNFPKDCVNDVWSSLDGKIWQLEKINTFGTPAFNSAQDWEGRHTAGYVVHDDQMWIVGGDANQGHHQNDVWRSTDGKAWHAVTRDVPWDPRHAASVFVHDEALWMIAGNNMQSDVWKLTRQ